MADDDELKQREFLLKVVQAWTDARIKIATGATLLNGAVLATAITLIKDKGEGPHVFYGLRTSAAGLFLGAGALAYVVLNTEILYGRMVKGQKDLRARQVVHWVPTAAFYVLVGFSIFSFGSSVVSFMKYSESAFQEKKVPHLELQGQRPGIAND